MKKAKYTLKLEYADGSQMQFGNQTQTECYNLIERWQQRSARFVDGAWEDSAALTSWMITTGKILIISPN
jgi:hypothetical protein